MGLNLAGMPIFTRTLPLGHLKYYMLGGTPKMLWQVQKELEKEELRGQEGYEGPRWFIYKSL